MTDKRATLEIIAPTVEEAVAKGLADLGLPEDAVEVEVLDQGSRGLFGLGSRHARIRLAVKSDQQISARPPAPAPEAPAPAPRPAPPRERVERQERQEARPAPAEEKVEDRPRAVQAPVERVEESLPEDGEEAHELCVARETVSELLEKMRVTARVTARFGEADDDKSRVPIHVDVRGDDLSILIGRRAETLNALQYISNLIISKELGHSGSVIIDVEGYRSRREGQIRQLARRMADQAVKTGRRQVLEPMSPSERRIIHMELRSNPQVYTESVGEEPRRKVTILPKE
jgi:spoIIIJ-associated protein